MLLRFYIEDNVGVSIIDNIPHCNTENDLKRRKNQEMLLRYFTEDKSGVSIMDSTPHCHTEMISKGAKIKKCGFVSIYTRVIQ